ncbi:MAG: type II secretion system minor pseudopilin GspH [Steroidobacteraceae bacterium]
MPIRDARELRSGGFTLIEILVVIVIIGVVTVGAVLSMSFTGPERELRTEGDRLADLMNYAQEQGELQTRELGLYCTDHSYKFLAFDARRQLWVPINDDDALKPRTLPDAIRLQLEIEGREVVLASVADEQRRAGTPTSAQASSPASAPGSSPAGALTPADLQPQVMIFSNGDLTSFRVTLAREGSDATVAVQPDHQGRIKVKVPKEHVT